MNKKIRVHNHVTHVVKIDILTGHEKVGNLHFILKIIFSLHIYRKTVYYLKTSVVNYKNIACYLTKFCSIIYFRNHEIDEGDNH